ncbi:MAG TPA: hypothetical protein VKR06_32665 [Ktedonosporobacter sp.]|nr:hypothetical protein [Ktedonosporobacter sp.]
MRFTRSFLTACLCALLLVGGFSFLKAPVAHADVNGCPSGQNTLAKGDILNLGSKAVDGKVFLCQDAISQIFFASYAIKTIDGSISSIRTQLFDVGNDKALAEKADDTGSTETETSFATANGQIKACGLLMYMNKGKFPPLITEQGCTPSVSV